MGGEGVWGVRVCGGKSEDVCGREWCGGGVYIFQGTNGHLISYHLAAKQLVQHVHVLQYMSLHKHWYPS